MSQAVPQTVMTFPDGYPELLEQMGQILGRKLLDLGLPLAIANAKAFEMIEAIREEIGGQQQYIPKGEAYEMSIRDESIYAKFKGANYHDLAHEFDLTTVQIRNIVKRGRARDVAKRQHALFPA
jgi:Mor family transcriptional regulator